MKFLEGGSLYFALVFVAGFALGITRTLWVVPRVGERMAELMETPIMLAVTILSARFVVRRLSLPATPGARLGTGVIALALLLAAEFGVVLWVRKLTIRAYIHRRDPVAGMAYLVMLVLFALMPFLIS